MTGQINTFIKLRNRGVIKYSKEVIVLIKNACHVRDFRFYSERVWKVLCKLERKAALIFVKNVI